MKVYLVGGAVRDKLLGLPIKERDWVVTGATAEEMKKLGYQQVGKEFPVFLHPKTREEYALARKECKIEAGYKGFIFDTSTHVLLRDDLNRRDLTINAMAYDQDNDEIIDPYGGQQDIQNKILRHVSSAFVEDPVRVLRIGRFWARYAHLGFTIAPETMQLMCNMVKAGEVNALIAERVWKELERALAEKNPEKFFEVLAQCGALSILFPHLNVKGPGINALIAAKNISPSPLIRYAALVHAMPEDINEPKPEDRKQVIAALNARYRLPNTYRELSTLVGLHAKTALDQPSFTPGSILKLFYMLDIFRRELRFKHFVTVCTAIAKAKQLDFNADQLLAYAQAAKMVDVQALIKEGLKGQQLAEELKKRRLNAIQTCMGLLS